MKFLVPLSPELAQWLRVEGHDAVHASAISLNQAPDAVILRVPRLLATLGAEGPA